MATNPLVLAAIGIGGAYLLSRKADGEDGPPAPPSTQGQFSRVSTGIPAAAYRPGAKSQMVVPAKYGYVQPYMNAVSNPGIGDGHLMVGMPKMWVSSHGGAFKVQAGRVNGRAWYVTTERSRRLHVIAASSGRLGIPTVAAYKNYYGLRVGYANFDSDIAPLFRWDVVPSGVQSSMYNESLASGQRFLVPDTELSSDQLAARSAMGQVAASFSVRNGSNFVSKEGFYDQGVAFVRTDGAAGSLNWADITDENPDVVYFVSETGMVALNTRTMRRASAASLRPRWKNLRYGAVPVSPNPFLVNPLNPAHSEMSGGWKNRSFWWSETLDLPANLYGAKQPRPTLNWDNIGPEVSTGRTAAGRKARVYPSPSAFAGRGVGLYKFKGSGNTRYGCKDNRCWLQSITSGYDAIPTRRGEYVAGADIGFGRDRSLNRVRPGFFGGPNMAPYDLHAPVVLDAFVNTKMGFYNSTIKFSGDE